MTSDELKIHTQINSRYRIFDASGELPFSIVFGFCRRSPTDVDPRPILLETAGSVLDVPYALGQGLLTLHEISRNDERQWSEVDVTSLKNIAPKASEFLSLPSPVNRTCHWRNAFTVFHSQIDVNGTLAAILETGKRYVIRVASKDLGVKKWAYGEEKQSNGGNDELDHEPGLSRLVNSQSTASNAKFNVVKSLAWPPKIEIRMRLRQALASSDVLPANDSIGESNTILEVSAVNTGSETITIQTQGDQRFLVPWDHWQPEPGTIDDRTRIICASPRKPPTSSLLVVDAKTNELVKDHKQRRVCHLYASNADRRPKAEDLVTLLPGVPIVRDIDLTNVVKGLDDGHYKIRMQPKGCRWWHGEVELEGDEDKRVPTRLCRTMGTPLMLESQDEVDYYSRGN